MPHNTRNVEDSTLEPIAIVGMGKSIASDDDAL